MFNIQLKRWALFGLIVSAWLATDTMIVSAQVEMVGARRNLDRSNIWLSLSNNGGQPGSSFGKAVRGMHLMSYPGIVATSWTSPSGPDVDWYFPGKPSGFNGSFENTAISIGGGIVSLTQVGGEKVASFTGPRVTTIDVIPHIYDIENAPEASWGINTRAPARANNPGESTANWWPGAPALKDGDPGATQPYEIHNYDYGVYAPVQNAAETTMISEWESNAHGGENVLTAVRKVLAWSHQDLDDMLIYDLEWTNTSDQQITGVYFGIIEGVHIKQSGIAYRYHYHQGLHNHSKGEAEFDDWMDYSEDPNFKGDANFVGRNWHIQWDGDSPLSPDDDTGDPYFVARCDPQACFDPGFLNATLRPDGMPLSPEHVGIGPLAWRGSGTGAWNAADAAVGYLDPQGEPLWHFWESFSSFQSPADTDPAASSEGPQSDTDRYDAWSEPSHAVPQTVELGMNDLMFGPYTIDPGDKVKLVLALVVGTGAHSTINSTTGYPLSPVDWMFNTIGASGIGVNDAQRNAELAKGHQGLWTNASHALFAYANEWQIPNTPPDVDFDTENNIKAQTTVTWNGDAESAINPDYGTADVSSYRVYQSEYAETGPWILKAEIPATGASSYSWEDTESIAGFSNFYNVRSVSSAKSGWSEGTKALADLPAQMASHVTGGMESGFSSPEQRTDNNIVPSQPGDAVTDGLERQIRVVPNPLNVASEEQSYAGALKMRFVGIPTRAKIMIFSPGGDLVSTVFHNDPGSGEVDFTLMNRTLTGQLYSGVYYWVVESLLPGSQGKTQNGWLAIHR